LATALSLMGDATLYTVLPTQAGAAGIALSSVGIVLGTNRAVRLLLNGPAGLAYDRFSRRRLFVPAMFVGAISTAIYAVTRGLWPLLVGRLLWGLAWSGIWVGGATMILDVTHWGDRGRWTGLYQTWFFMGAAAGAFAGGALTDWLGYETTMWIGAGVTAVGAVAGWLLLPETRGARSHGALTEPEMNVPVPNAGRGLVVAASLQGINRFVIAGVLSATLGLLVQGWARAGGLAVGVATATGALMAARTLVSMGSAPLAGVLSDWLHNRWRVASVASMVGAVSMALLALGRPGVTLIGLLLGAAAGGGVQAMATTLTGDMAVRARQGRAIGLLHTAGDLGSALGPPVAYALLPWIDLRGVYLLCAGLFAAGVLLAQQFWGRHVAAPGRL
jgi:MFS family permease